MNQNGNIIGRLIGRLIFSAIFILLGIALLIMGIAGLKDARATEHWPSVTGVVRASSVEKFSNADSDGREATLYEPDIIYDYTVDGKPYSSNEIALDFRSRSYKKSSDAQMIVERYSPGSQIDVYYDPQHPIKAVLEPGVGIGNYIVIGSGLLFMILGPLCGLFGRVRRR